MEINLIELFTEILQNAQSVDMAEADFKQMMVDDPDLKTAYKDYCREAGVSERNGFHEFCREYIEETNNVWDSLNDYDE